MPNANGVASTQYYKEDPAETLRALESWCDLYEASNDHDWLIENYRLMADIYLENDGKYAPSKMYRLHRHTTRLIDNGQSDRAFKLMHTLKANGYDTADNQDYLDICIRNQQLKWLGAELAVSIYKIKFGTGIVH